MGGGSSISGISTRWNSESAAGSRAGRMWMMEYQARTPARPASGWSRASIEPSENRSPGIVPLGDGDHFRRQVDAGDVEAHSVQIRGHPAGAAADVGDRSTPSGSDKIGERAEQRVVHRIFFHGGDLFGIAGGDGVVGRSRSTQERFIGHDEPP